MISLDFETYCDIDIRKVGLDAYTAHPTFEVMMMAYRLDDGPLSHWQAHLEPFPQEVRERLIDPNEEKWAFNAGFERRALLSIRIATPVEGWRCSMALSYMRGFTGSLGAVGEQMLLPQDQQKQKIGARLIRKFCMPQRITRNQPHRRRDWNTDPDDWELFTNYNLADVYAEEAVRDRLINYPIPDDEWALYAIDQKVNDRGMPFDRVFATNVSRMSEYRRDELLDKMRALTGLENPNSQSELLRWLRTQGYPFEDIRENTVKRALALNLPCAEVLALRQWSAKTATKKAATALLSAGADDRIRHMFQFVGASRTGRWCIAEGSPVLVRDVLGRISNCPIESVSITDKVWDGDAWVAHEGVVFSGVKSVISYEGVRATVEHQVYVSDYVSLPLGEAVRQGLNLWRGSRDDYAIYNLSSDLAVRSLLYRDDPLVVERTLEVSSEICCKVDPASVLCCDQKNGAENFCLEVLEHCVSFKEAQAAEIRYIAEHREKGRPYNVSPGGEDSGGARANEGVMGNRSGLGCRVSCKTIRRVSETANSGEGALGNAPSEGGCLADQNPEEVAKISQIVAKRRQSGANKTRKR